MNRPKKAAEMYEIDQGYIRATRRDERRTFGPQKYYRGRSVVKKYRWYHKMWDGIKDFFSPPKDKLKEAKEKHGRIQSHIKREHAVTGRQFHSRRT